MPGHGAPPGHGRGGLEWGPTKGPLLSALPPLSAPPPGLVQGVGGFRGKLLVRSPWIFACCLSWLVSHAWYARRTAGRARAPAVAARSVHTRLALTLFAAPLSSAEQYAAWLTTACCGRPAVLASHWSTHASTRPRRTRSNSGAIAQSRSRPAPRTPSRGSRSKRRSAPSTQPAAPTPRLARVPASPRRLRPCCRPRRLRPRVATSLPLVHHQVCPTTTGGVRPALALATTRTPRRSSRTPSRPA